MSDNPIQRFEELLTQATTAGVYLPNAMSLATADAQGRPSVRMVLLKGVDERGFVFFTNLESRKGRELKARPWASLCFHWSMPEVQIRIEGEVEQVSDEEADEYFATRGRGSQIGAWASKQSDLLPSRETLTAAVAEVEARFEGAEVPRPPFWSGFLVRPERIEFWTGMPDRLHERISYTKSIDGWHVEHLYP